MAELKNTIINDVGYLQLPSGTISQRPVSPNQGMIRWNNETNYIEYYNGVKWIRADIGLPYLHYNEGTRADLYNSNWNNTTTYTMTNFGGLGQVTAHGFTSGPVTYTLTLNDLPYHTKVKYCVYWHLVDSLDTETNNLYLMNSSESETEVLRFTKDLNQNGFTTNVLASGASATWSGSQTYSYKPWGGTSIDGYILFDSGYYDHTSSTFTARHVMGADQAQTDEAEYLSHVMLWLE